MEPSYSTVSSEGKTQMTEEQPLKIVRKFLAMAGGDGDESYAKHSPYQGVLINEAYGILSSCLERLSLPAADTGAFTISDLGCSSGPNTINFVSRVVNSVKELYHKSGQDEPEFTAYFNDLPSTDFNVLFQLLDSQSRDFYYAGLPGSFYERILPRSSVNLFLTASSLHWISQAPPAVTDKKSSVYNKDRIWLHGSNPEVINAYKQQGFHDMRSFLDARADELVPGGLLFCIFGCAAESSGESAETWLRPFSGDKPFTAFSMTRVFELVFDELVSQGILTEEQRAACNLPWYILSKEEVEEILKSYDDVFQVEHLDHLTLSARARKFKPDNEESAVEFTRRHLAAVFQPLFSPVLGEDLTYTLLRRVGQFYLEKQKSGCTIQFLSQVLALTRK